MKNFGLIGASGYIAPRHMRAIKETGNSLIVALDKNDSVGIIDSYFPDADFFTEIERFDRHLQKLNLKKNSELDFISICTPNYLHDSHIRICLRNNADAICEKPLVLNPRNLESLIKIEKETGKKIWNVLQLRLHESIIALKNKVKIDDNFKYDIDLTYLTSRGNWYYSSWKGDISKSGGVTTNIGVHFFDMLIWIFGKVQINKVHIHTHDRASGYLELENARVRWFLGINSDLIPKSVKSSGLTTFRSIKINDEEFEFSGGFTNLHTKVYQQILDGKGFDVSETRQSIDLVSKIRDIKPEGLVGDYHPLAKLKLSKHPFLK